MAPIKLASNYISSATSVSNVFLDTFMPAANGEYVKVYLCLLRMFTDPAMKDYTLSDLADLLEVMERDIIRAIRYWENVGVLAVEYTDDGYPVSINFLPISSDTKPSVSEDVPVKENVKETVKEAVKDTAKETSSEPKKKKSATDETFKELVFISEQLLGNTLSATDLDKLCYIYDELGFSEDLIEYLIEYCVSNQKKSFRYIEKVALSWSEQGIDSVDAAKNSHTIYTKKIYSCMKAFGLDGRNPGKSELEFINKWYDEYGFENDVILEAISRTIQTIHKPSFEYTDSVLKNWKNVGIHTVADIDVLDTKPKRTYFTTTVNSNNRQAVTGTAPKSAPVNNRFNNFHQRTYDFAELEKKLVVKKESNDEA